MDKGRIASKDYETAYIESTLVGIQKLRNSLVTQIAHNFRTPLTSVIGFAEMLLDDRPLTDEQRVEYARFIHYEGIRLSKLIDDVLELSFLERGNCPLKLENQTLQDVVAEAISKIAAFARGRFVAVKQIHGRPVVLPLDRAKIIQATYQLLHNAVRFTMPHHNVEVNVKTIGDWAEIKVQDGGPGIPEEEIPLLIERIGRVYTQEQDGQSTGVGLTIVKHIMDLHRGEIQIQSKLGEGSLFTLRIPGLEELTPRN